MSCRFATDASCPPPGPEGRPVRETTDRGALASPARSVAVALVALAFAAPMATAREETPARQRPSATALRVPPRALVDDAPRIGLVLGAEDRLAESRRRGAELATCWLRAQGGPAVALHVGRATGVWSSVAEVARDLLCAQDCQGLLTSPDGDGSHLMAQIAARQQAPLVALGGTSSLTRVPLPWLAQIVPDERAQLRALLQALPERPLRPVPVVFAAGRAGRRTRDDLEFLGRALELSFQAVPVGGALDPGVFGTLAERSGPIVVWLEGEALDAALTTLASWGWSGPVLLPRRAFEAGWMTPQPVAELTCHVVRCLPPEPSGDAAAFAQAYRLAYGVDPDEAAACAFDALLLLAAALRPGPAVSAPFSPAHQPPGLRGVTGRLALGATGERQGRWTVTVLPPTSLAPAATLPSSPPGC